MRSVEFYINGNGQTRSDSLFSDCLRVETATKIHLQHDEPLRINLSVYNSSSEGRMAKLTPVFNAKLVSVKIPNNYLYIAPDGKTTTYALITPLVVQGRGKISFNIE